MGSLAVVYDTNALVSAVGFRGTPLHALLRGFDEDARLVASEATLDELSRVLEYDRLPITEPERIQYLSLLRSVANIVDPDESVTVVERDPDDDKFLEYGVAGDATFLVSGDEHLLEVGTFRGIDVCTPATFLSRTASESPSDDTGTDSR